MMFLFKNIFGQKCNEEKLKSFLNAIISSDESNKNKSTEINEIAYCNVELLTSKYSETGGTTILDIHAKDNKNKVDYLIKMQVLKDKDMFTRTVFNNSKIFQTLFEKGKPLAANQKVYSINILYFNIFHPNEKNYKKYFHTLFTQEEGDTENAIRNPIYIYIELPRFKYDDFEKDNMLHYWLSFLKLVNVTHGKIENENNENESGNVEIYKEIIKVKEIAEAFEICGKKIDKKDENYYSSYRIVVSVVENALKYAKEKEEYAKEIDEYAKEIDEYAKEKEEENMKLKMEVEEKKEENMKLKMEIKRIRETINLMNEMNQSRKEEINRDSYEGVKKQKTSK